MVSWRQSESRRFAGFRVQNPRLLQSSRRRRRKKSNKISRNEALTNFRIKGTEDLWNCIGSELVFGLEFGFSCRL